MKTSKEFLIEVDWEEEDIISYEWEEALEEVEEDWSTFQYVNNQTDEICLEAVKQNEYTIQYVDKNVFKKEA